MLLIKIYFCFLLKSTTQIASGQVPSCFSRNLIPHCELLFAMSVLDGLQRRK